MSVRLHPEAGPDPLTLRWVTDTSVLTEPSEAMRELVDDGTLAALEVTAGAIHTRIPPGGSWTQIGDRVRSVLFQELSSAQRRTEGTDLVGQVAALIRRDVAPYVDSHGGDIRIVSLEDGALTVALDGTCGSCTLRNSTLRNLVARAVQTRYPEIRTVNAVRT